MFRKIICTPLAFAFAIAAAHAQSNYAVVRGVILDPQSHPVAGARVHITATGTGAVREVTANDSGLYQIAGLQPGSYALAVDTQGFAQLKQIIDLEVGQQATIDLHLRLGSDTQP